MKYAIVNMYAEIRGKEMEETKAVTRFSMKFWTSEQVNKIDQDTAQYIYYLPTSFCPTLLLKTH